MVGGSPDTLSVRGLCSRATARVWKLTGESQSDLQHSATAADNLPSGSRNHPHKLLLDSSSFETGQDSKCLQVLRRFVTQQAVFDYYKGFVHSRQLRIPPMESSVTVLMLDAMPLAWC